MKNKCGDIPITILVIGVFAVCSLALLSFYYSDTKVKNSFVGIDKMEKMNLQMEQYLVYKNLDNLDTKINRDGDVFFYQEKNITKGFLLWKKEKTMFSVKYNLP